MSRTKAVSEIMTKPVITMEFTETVPNALKIMVEKEIGCLVITMDRNPVGMLTERDVIRGILHDTSVLSGSVGALMNSPLISALPETQAVDALRLMKDKKIRHLPVVKDGALLGILTVHTDLLYWLLTIGSGHLPADQMR